MYEFLGDARIINSIEELPKIGDTFKHYGGIGYVISLNAFQEDDENGDNPEWLFYNVYVSDNFNRYTDLDTYMYFKFAIKKVNLEKSIKNC